MTNEHGDKEDNLKVIVFDLDYTLWPFWVDTHVDPPFRKQGGHVVDSRGKRIKFYPEVPEVLEELTSKGYQLGVASRTSEIEGAEQLLQLFGWNKYFSYKEIYPGKKTEHFSEIRKKSSVPLSRMLFFDDEHRNIHDLQQFGVVSILVNNGITKKVVKEGIEEFKRRRK